MRLGFRARLVALGSLVVYGLLVVVLARLLVHNLGLAVLLAVSSAVILYAIWLLLTAKRRWGWLLLLLGIIGLGVGVFGFGREAVNRRLLLVVVALAVLYLALLVHLKGYYWQERRRYGESTAETAHFRRPYLIINPKSGNGRALRAGIAERARRQGISVTMLKKGDDVEALARQAADVGADVLGVSGGDGSIGAVAKVALERDLPMVVLPGGTRCHFARDLGMNPNHIADALEGFRGVPRRIDIGDINGRIFLNNASFGLYADIVSQPDYRAHKLRVSRTVLTELVRSQRQPYALRIRQGKHRLDQAVQILVGVGAYETLNLFELGQRQQLDAGKLQVTAITQLDDALVRRLLTTLRFTPGQGVATSSGMEQWTSRRLTVTSPEATIKVGVDGEFEEYGSPVRLRVLPQALTVFVPAEGQRGHAQHVFDPEVLRRTWRAVAHGRD